MKWRCNSCNEVYADGQWPPHVCPPEIIEHAEFDDAGKQTREEKRTKRDVIRNENFAPGLCSVDGKWVRRAPHPEERGQMIWVECEAAIVSEGAGRTLVEG